MIGTKIKKSTAPTSRSGTGSIRLPNSPPSDERRLLMNPFAGAAPLSGFGSRQVAGELDLGCLG